MGYGKLRGCNDTWIEVILQAGIPDIKSEEPTPNAKKSPRSFVYVEGTPKLLWEVEALRMWGEQSSDHTAFDEDCLILLIRDLFGQSPFGVATQTAAQVLTVEQNQSEWICSSFWKQTLGPNPSNHLLESQCRTTMVSEEWSVCPVWDRSEVHSFWWEVFKQFQAWIK